MRRDEMEETKIRGGRDVQAYDRVPWGNSRRRKGVKTEGRGADVAITGFYFARSRVGCRGRYFEGEGKIVNVNIISHAQPRAVPRHSTVRRSIRADSMRSRTRAKTRPREGGENNGGERKR